MSELLLWLLLSNIKHDGLEDKKATHLFSHSLTRSFCLQQIIKFWFFLCRFFLANTEILQWTLYRMELGTLPCLAGSKPQLLGTMCSSGLWRKHWVGQGYIQRVVVLDEGDVSVVEHQVSERAVQVVRLGEPIARSSLVDHAVLHLAIHPARGERA